MTDPFQLLAGPDAPLEPRSEFRAGLRASVAAELARRALPSPPADRISAPDRSETGSDRPLPAGGPPSGAGGIWAAVNAADAPALIGFLVDVFGFDAQLVVPGATPDVVDHSQLRWPEGGTVQVGSADRHGNVFSQRPVGVSSLYVITADPTAVWLRCQAAEVEVVSAPSTPDYDPGGLVFTVRDPEGNLWSFGTYAG